LFRSGLSGKHNFAAKVRRESHAAVIHHPKSLCEECKSDKKFRDNFSGYDALQRGIIPSCETVSANQQNTLDAARRTVMTQDHPKRVDNTREITKQRQNDVNPELSGQSDLKKHPYRRENNRKNDA
jgi:hypothetical protein